MKVTDAMIEKARDKAEELVRERFQYPGDPGSFHHDVQDMATRIVVAALAVAPDPAPDDAGMNAAMDALIDAAHTKGCNAGYETQMALAQIDIGDARQRILALHAQATHAGLRELEGHVMGLTRGGHHSTFDLGFDAGLSAVSQRIDTMLSPNEMSEPIEFPDNTPLGEQVKALSDVLMNEFSEYFTKSEGAIEMAIRLLREQRDKIAMLKEATDDR